RPPAALGAGVRRSGPTCPTCVDDTPFTLRTRRRKATAPSRGDAASWKGVAVSAREDFMLPGGRRRAALPAGVRRWARGRHVERESGNVAKKDKSDYIIQSVSHALDLLEEFRGDTDELGVTELSK